MRALVLGGTGRIGSAVTRALLGRGAAVTVLCRSASSRERAEELGAEPLTGDIAEPGAWAHALAGLDAVVHAAAGFDAAMAEVDRRLLDHLLGALRRTSGRRLVYTGGVWLYGSSVDRIDERAPYAPPRGWRWMAAHADRVLAADGVDGRVVHPANVVDEATGVPPILLEEARAAGEVCLPAPVAATWPLVGREDLAELYALALDRGERGQAYIAASEPAVPLGRIASKVAAELGLPDAPVQRSLGYWTGKYGEWASGYGLNQNVSSDKARRSLGWTPRFRWRDVALSVGDGA